MPDGGPKLLLIDGNNMCHRVYWTHQGLSYKGKSTGVIYGFFRQLVHLHKDFPDYFRVIAWDGGYVRRLDESKKGVEAGIIPSAYKENRKDRDPQELEDIMEQMRQLQEVLELVKCLQVKVDGIEADDLINTYADYASRWKGEAIVVSSDRDFYQILKPGVKIYDAMKAETWDEERFQTEFAFSPSLWVDAGAIMGDAGDNIHGADGWGPVTTFKYVREFGTMDSVLAGIAAKAKKTKKEEELLKSGEKLKLARSLKQMDVIPGLPRPRILRPKDKAVLDKFFIDMGFVSLLKETWRLV